MIDIAPLFLSKAEESLEGAESELTNGRHNYCANRCYYACFQAAVHALITAGIRPPGSGGQWSHAFVPAQFDGHLVNRRKLYPTELRNVLARGYLLRQTADYRSDLVTPKEATRALRRAWMFVAVIQAGGGEAQ